MFKFLFFFLIGFIALPVFILWRMMHSVRNGLRKTQQRGFRGNGYGYQQEPEPEQPQGKVFSDIEEDVEFEAVEGPRREVEQPTRIEHEDQVTDAEFEEIN